MLQAGTCRGCTSSVSCLRLSEGHTPIRTKETPGMGNTALANVFTRLWHRAAPAWVRCQFTTLADC